MPNVEGDSRARCQMVWATTGYAFCEVSMLITLPLVDDQGRSYSKAPRRCRAGWLTVRTTVLCFRFNSPTLCPPVPYHYP